MSGVRETNQAKLLRNSAELLLELGRGLMKRIRCGAGIEEAASQVRTASDNCLLALEFVRSRDVVKFRAMVEDWSRDRIVAELRGAERIWQCQPESSGRER